LGLPLGYYIREKLRKILPIALVAIATTGIIQLFTARTRLFAGSMIKAADMAESAPVMADNVTTVMAAAPEVARSLQTASTAVPIALWFLFGAMFVVVLVFLLDLFRKK